MKGFVIHFGKKAKAICLPGRREFSLRTLAAGYGIQAFLIALFIMGLFIGAVCSRGMDSGAEDRLDFLFVTNIKARAQMSGFSIFLSCFVPYFLFVFGAFLCAFSAWGFVAVPLLSAFKGFSVGLSSAVVFSAYRMSGVGFFILIVLPGTVLFLFSFIRYSRDCFRLSVQYMRLTVFGTDKAASLGTQLRAFFKKSVFAFIFSGACSVADMLLWVLFADKFHFY